MALTDEEKRRIFEEEKLKKEMQGKSVGVSVLLSVLIPGLGDLYCGSWIKAVIFFVFDLVSFALFFVGIGLFVYLFVWICGIISAWLSASKSGKRQIRKVEKSMGQGS